MGFWVDLKKVKKIKILKNIKRKEGGGDADLDLIEDTLEMIYAKMNLDVKN